VPYLAIRAGTARCGRGVSSYIGWRDKMTGSTR